MNNNNNNNTSLCRWNDEISHSYMLYMPCFILPDIQMSYYILDTCV